MRFKFSYSLLIFTFILFLSFQAHAVPEGWGEGWSDYKTLSTASQLSEAPKVLTDSMGNYLIFWTTKKDQNLQIMYMKVDSNGKILKKAVSLTQDTEWSVHDFVPFMINDQQIDLFSLVIRNGTYELRYNQHIDNNSSDSNEKSAITLKKFKRPAHGLNGVKDSNGNYHLFWSNSDTGNHALYYTRITSALEIEIDSKLLTNNPRMTTSSDSAIDSQNRIHVIYNDQQPDTNWKLSYIVLDDSGEILKEPVNLGKSMKYKNNIVPNIIINSEDQAYIFWCHSTHGGFGMINYEVFVNMVDSDLNILYDEPIQISNHGYQTVMAFPPSAFVDDEDQVHVVWADSLTLPMTVYYKIIKNYQIIKPTERLVIHHTTFWLPNLQIDRDNNKHLFLMQFIGNGNTNLAYMNTVNPARVTYWNRIGLNEDYLFISAVFQFGRNIIFSIVAIVLNFLPILVSGIAMIFINKYLDKKHILLKILIIIGILLIFQMTPIFLSVTGSTMTYRLIMIGLASLLTIGWGYLTKKKMKLTDFAVCLLIAAVWIFCYTILMLMPVGTQLIH